MPAEGSPETITADRPVDAHRGSEPSERREGGETVKPRIGTIVVGIACLALGAAIQRAYDTRQATASQSAKAELTPEGAPKAAPKAAAPIWTVAAVERSKIDYSNQPFWAWGVTEPPARDEKQAVQGAPGTPVLVIREA